jgi:DeoR/GlpR family transcriptional regulator of sugar metabolism
MLIERHEKIMRMLANGKLVKIPEFVSEFGVSVSTIRRDLDFLEDHGFLKKVYGGAVLVNQKALEPSIKHREAKNLDLKTEIAEKVRSLVDEGDTIALDNGTTSSEIAKQLVDINNLTIITNSLSVAIALIENPTNTVYLVGGHLRRGEMALSGALSNDILKNFSVDKCIISISGISMKGYLSEYNVEEAAIRRTMMSIAKISILAADHTKFGTEALAKVCDISDFDILVTDSQTKPEDIMWIKEKGIEII